MSNPLRHLADEIARLDQRGLLRSDAPQLSTGIDFCSNDYLDRSVQPATPGVSRETVPPPSGAGASRLVAGDHSLHRDLEARLCTWLGVESSLLFSSGYAANLGTIAALAAPGDLVVSDELNHASIIDGCRLSRAQIHVYPHLQLEHAIPALRAHRATFPIARRWLVTESYFSMDADIPDLRRAREICDQEDAALLVDEAHSLGIFGTGGRGLLAESGVRADVFIGMFGKAFGTAGGFVGGQRNLTRWLWNRARSFVFSTGMSPLVAAATLDSLRFLETADAARAALANNTAFLRTALSTLPGAGVDFTIGGVGHIIPIGFPHATDLAMPMAASLKADGYWVQGIRPPTVPSSRIRITVRAGHTHSQLEGLATTFGRSYRHLHAP